MVYVDVCLMWNFGKIYLCRHAMRLARLLDVGLLLACTVEDTVPYCCKYAMSLALLLPMERERERERESPRPSTRVACTSANTTSNFYQRGRHAIGIIQKGRHLACDSPV